MTVDLACGVRAFLDLTFVGLDAVPALGEERFARALLRTPGGGANVAIGAARLGLVAALAPPLGRDADGAFLRAALEAEGVRCAERTIERTAVTAVMPVGDERAMASHEPDDGLTRADLEAFAPRAVVLSLGRLHCAPHGAALYALGGDEDARVRAGSGVPEAAGARALIVNAREARLLCGMKDAAAAAVILAERSSAAGPARVALARGAVSGGGADAAPPVAAATARRPVADRPLDVVVTLGADGALGVLEGELQRVPGVAVDVVDTTGAGDLFAAAYVWADLGGATPRERLAWAVLAAALSVGAASAAAGAQTIDALAQAGAQRGLALPPRYLPTEGEEEP